MIDKLRILILFALLPLACGPSIINEDSWDISSVFHQLRTDIQDPLILDYVFGKVSKLEPKAKIFRIDSGSNLPRADKEYVYVSFDLRKANGNLFQYKQLSFERQISKDEKGNRKLGEFKIHKEPHDSENHIYIDLQKRVYIWAAKDLKSDDIQSVVSALQAKKQIGYKPYGKNKETLYISSSKVLDCRSSYWSTTQLYYDRNDKRKKTIILRNGLIFISIDLSGNVPVIIGYLLRLWILQFQTGFFDRLVG